MRRVILSALAVLSTTAPSPAQDASQILSQISAGTIAVISDGDFVAETYSSGQLAPAEAGHRDVLTVFTRGNGGVRSARIEVSNSVTAAPEIMRLTPDGRTAFVVERLGTRAERATTIRDLPAGQRLFAIDVSAGPKLADTATLAPFPEAMTISPDGSTIAVVSNTPDESVLQIVRFANGRLDTPSRFNLKDLGVSGDAAGPRGGVTATNVQWHPSARFIAINISSQNRVAFFEISGDRQRPSLRSWGNIVEVGRDPYVGRFTPDGRHYITSDWGRDLAATNVEARLPTMPSGVSVIRFAAAGSEIRHHRVATATSDLSAEGLAISPDGKLIATVNMRTTAFAPSSPRFRREASVSLFAFDPESGAIEKLGDTPFDGVLPEGGVFDLAGDHFLATVFEGHKTAGADGSRAGAGLEVFRVVKQGRPQLLRLGRIELPHGVHQVDVAH